MWVKDSHDLQAFTKYTMYVKNFNCLFKSMFLRKNGRTEKN